MSLSGKWPPSKPYILELVNEGHSQGYIQGLTFLTQTKRKQERAHYFGGVPYALPPERFKRPVLLPREHIYGGTADTATPFIGEVGVCPQPGDFGALPDPSDIEEWDENCLQCNIWIPCGAPPNPAGWPVLVFFHGGYLQFGSPNGSDYIGLCDSSRPGEGKCILVLPGYRTNVFGFLAGKELLEESGYAGNYGFCDQRCALEWVLERIGWFGGDVGEVTVGGYSAGALSTFHQISHNFTLPPSSRLPLRRILMLANGCGIQPRTIPETQPQFNSLLSALNIPSNLPPATKLARLRKASASAIVRASLAIPQHEFRHVTDNIFVSADLFKSLDNGVWVKHFLENNCELLIAECESEHHAFATWHTPIPDTLDAVRARLAVDYPSPLIDSLTSYFCPATPAELPIISRQKCTTWSAFFGHLYAEIQVHATHRGLVDCLHEHGAGARVRRCRVGWRAKRADRNFPREMGATHGVDTALWFWGDGVGLELLRREEGVAKEWCESVGYWGWLEGRGWGGREEQGRKNLRYIVGGGGVSIIVDPDWERGMDVWGIIRRVQEWGRAE